MKRSFRKSLMAIIMAMVVVLNAYFMVSASTITISTKTTRIASIPNYEINDNYKCTSIQGLSVAASNNKRMYVIKANDKSNV